MAFLNVNTFLDQLNAQTLPADEQAIVNFYQASGDFSVAMINYRADHSLNQNELADVLNTTQSNISRYESGVHNFTLKTLLSLAAKMDINVNICVDKKHESTDCKVPVQQPVPLDKTMNEKAYTSTLRLAAA
jgi:transcriptional regulator with XRE-family HTH domain